MSEEIYKKEIGSIRFTIIKDLMFTYATSDYFSNVDMDQIIPQYSLKETLEVPYMAIVLEYENKKILIDAGIGYSEKAIEFEGHKFFLHGRLKVLLLKQGIEGSAITDVIISHLHADHIGGIFSDGVLNYPNATFHIAQQEWDFWHSSLADHQPPLFKKFIADNITPLKSLDLNLIKGDFTEILPNIIAVQSPGHSAGQMALIIGKEKQQLLYAADTFLRPLNIEHLDWTSNFDYNQKNAKSSKSKLLNIAYQHDMLIHSSHFDFPGLGRVNSYKNKWKWQNLTSSKS